jgi:hypothetical protein
MDSLGFKIYIFEQSESDNEIVVTERDYKEATQRAKVLQSDKNQSLRLVDAIPIKQM